ncbi:MAG: hypothetical protein KAH68_02990, partial [Draconibacterium sp.]|nr:hypothetical protein [Draconibacterium sp.]
VDNSSLRPFDMLHDMVKKSKHIFATEYLNLAIDECAQLIKLSHESGSVIQVNNPFYYTSALQWLNDNVSSPMFLTLSKFIDNSNLEETLHPMLLMLSDITGIDPKKVGVTAFESDQNEMSFTNIRLEFGDASVVNLNYGNQFSLDKFSLKGYSKNKYFSFDFNKNIFLLNNSKIDFSNYSTVNEFDSFIESIQSKTQKSSNIESYLAAIQLVKLVEKKIEQFIV